MHSDLSLKQRITRYLSNVHTKNPERWINGGEIEREALIAGYKASNASRRCRELVNEDVLEKRETKSGTVEYRLKTKREVYSA